MTCAKKQVICCIGNQDGHTYFGSNSCDNPQLVCPRLPGEGYDKCVSICRQESHAEVDALKLALEHCADLRGASAVIVGHTYSCKNCQEALYKAGIEWISCIDTVE